MSQISFFKPEFFWALLFLGIIVLIHLLKRPRVVSLNFSTLRFFHQNAVRSRKSRRLRNILKLITRCALVFLIIFLFARPFNKTNPLSNINNPQTDLYVWIDPTPSMEYRAGQISLGQQACDLVDSLQHLLSVSSKLYLYDHIRDDFFKQENAPVSFQSYYINPDLHNVLQKIRPSKESRGHPVLVLFSDFQKPLAASIDSVFGTLPFDLTIIYVSMIPHSPWNYTLGRAELVTAGESIVKTRVRTSGKPLEAGILFAVMENIRTGKVDFSALKNDSIEVQLPVRTSSRVTGGKIVLDNSDPLLFDNTSYFISGQPTASRVIIVGTPKENFVIAAALRASGEKWNNVVLRDEGELSYDELDSADLIIVNSLKKPSRVLDAFVSSRRRQNKAIIFSTGAQEQLLNWSTSVLSKAVTGSTGHYSSVKMESPLSPVLPDTLSVLWRGFPKMKSKEVAIYSYCKSIPGEPLMTLSNGAVILSQTVDKAGRLWLISATSLGISQENNLCETGFFVPLLDRICGYALSGIRTPGQSWIAGVVRKNPFYGSGISASVFDSDGKLVKTLQHQPAVLFQKPGIYKIVPNGEPSYFISVQSDPCESIMKYALPSIPENSTGKVLIVEKESFLQSVKSNTDTLMWYIPWLIIGLLLLVEIALWEHRKA